MSKSKVTVFSRGKIRNRPEFYFGENKLDVHVVDHYKYLGLNFNFNGKFTVAKKELYEKGNRAMFSLLRKSRRLQLPIDIQLQLFDVLVKPVLLYGCEVWAHEGTDILEKLHLSFCKYVLGVNKSTCTNMVYGELGATPLSLITQSRMVMFWARIKKAEENPKISSLLFQILLKMYKNDTFCSPWVTTVKNILEGCGFAGAWEHQRLPFSTNHFKVILQQRIRDQFLQKWSAEINISSKCINYKMFKTSLHLEDYLITLSYHQRCTMAKLRCRNHYLPIESGCRTDIPRNLRVCELCNDLGDFLFICPRFSEARKKYIKKVLVRSPSAISFCNLMNVKSTIQLANLCKYLQILMNAFKISV